MPTHCILLLNDTPGDDIEKSEKCKIKNKLSKLMSMFIMWNICSEALSHLDVQEPFSLSPSLSERLS